MLSLLTYLIIAGALIFLLLMQLERSGGDPSTRGIGPSMRLLAFGVVVFLLLFNLHSNQWIKYVGLGLGILCAGMLVVFLLALTGSSLIYQDTRKRLKPRHSSSILAQMVERMRKLIR